MQTGLSLRKGAALAAAFVVALGTAADAGAVPFNVFANANSIAFATNDAAPLDTGIHFNAGDTVQVSASGLWAGDGGPVGPVGPDGDTSDFYGISPYGYHYYSLVGKLGAAGSYFLVGSSYNGVAGASGNLYLGFLDSDSGNNSGFVTANVSAVPEPASAALLLGGAAVLAAVRRRRG